MLKGVALALLAAAPLALADVPDAAAPTGASETGALTGKVSVSLASTCECHNIVEAISVCCTLGDEDVHAGWLTW
jgi:hypothetical protein